MRRAYLSLDLAEVPVAFVLVAVGPDFLAFAVFEAVFEIASVDALVFESLDAFAVGLVLGPVAFVGASVDAFELSVAAGQVVEDCSGVPADVRDGVAGGAFLDLRADD